MSPKWTKRPEGRLNQKKRKMRVIIDYYNEELKKYKTAASKKGFLTRSRKSCEEHLEDLKRAYHGSGWLLGERINFGHIREMENEILLIGKFYKTVK